MQNLSHSKHYVDANYYSNILYVFKSSVFHEFSLVILTYKNSKYSAEHLRTISFFIHFD